MKRINPRLRLLIVWTVLLLLIILFATWVAAQKITTSAREQCFAELRSEAESMGKEIEQNVASSRQQLKLIAQVAADYDDFTDTQLWKKLDSYIASGMLSRIEILLPSNEILTQDGRTVDVSSQVSFAEEAAEGEHITQRIDDIVENDGQIVCHYVPITRDGETVAMLCGIAVLKDMPSQLASQPYSGQAAVYIIDRETGDFLMDSWHEELGNMWDFGSREMADGYDNDQLKQGVADGDSNYVVFVSQSTGSYLYFYYTPISVENWCVALSVSEDVVLEQAYNTSTILNIFIVFEVLCLLLCLGGMLRYIRLEMGEKQREMDMLNHIYDVERLLFNAHENSDLVTAALEQVGSMVNAEQIVYWMTTQPGYDELYQWNKPDSTIKQREFAAQRTGAHKLIQYFDDEKHTFYSGTDMLENPDPYGIKSMVAVPIRDTRCGVCGVLAAVNTTDDKDTEDTMALLRSFEVSFGMFCRNMRTYQSVKEQGERDALTGLYNRNRYMQDSSDCAQWYRDTLACVYVDANGLHELNNLHGHAAGDRMLQTVASVMTKYFGDEHTYRIGGDEFLAFVPDRPEAELQALGDNCVAEIRAAGYHIAIGVELARGVSSTANMVEAAEKKMYAAKHAYYAARGMRRSAR